MKKILVANRGEIAVRIIRTIREMGLKSVAVYSLTDSDSLHVALADEAICIGTAESHNSYLNINNILSAAFLAKADAIHPGYGFLAESAEFARAVEDQGLIFIGPRAETMELMGDKARARETVQKYGLPVVPGSDGILHSLAEVEAVAEAIGYPIVIKAASGGGGKGMRIVHQAEDLKKSFYDAQQEANASFADSRIYVEKFIEHARHIEVQILGDGHGRAVHLYERDCSIQRNNQKLIEEAPATILSADSRRYITELTAEVIGHLNYAGAGTVEYLYVEAEEQFYFMEMNTRIQVEHTVTEAITGIDLIEEQIKIALTGQLDLEQADLSMNGVALEVRVNAENPKLSFMPSPGKIEKLHFGQGKGVRIDTHIYPNYVVPSYYDSMIAKLIVHADSRKKAIRRMRRVLGETVIEPIQTNLDFQYYLLQHPEYLANKIEINFLTENNIID